MPDLHSVRHDLRDRFNGGEPELLDVLASKARTALDDPAGVGLEDAEPVILRSHLNRATRAASSHDVGKVLAETSAVSLGIASFEKRHAYAIARCDEIINALNPAEDTREAFAATLTLLGRHLAERQDTMEALLADTEEPDTTAYRTAAAAIVDALDNLDDAILALAGDS